jgi:pimeloyl-ACP methyl ester carboxylesterase
MQHRSMILGLVVAMATGWSAGSRAGAGFETIDFPTGGGLEARADLYEPATKSSTLILLFHQAGWSRGEYREIAPKLVGLGYRVMAVDQRSGKGVNGVMNETALRASKRGLPQEYLDAYVDLEAALGYARDRLHAKRVIAWGSSYSASLVLRLAAEHPDRVTAVVAFSPGEYFQKSKGPTYIQGLARKVKQPLFVTSAKGEREQVKPMFDASPSGKKTLFTPPSTGQHGSRALWLKSPDHDVYWDAIEEFLAEHVPARPAG